VHFLPDDAADPDLKALLTALTAGLGGSLPAQARDGGFVAPGARPELDEALLLRDDSRRVVAALEQRLQAETGLGLKIRHNAVLGYFVEIGAAKAVSQQLAASASQR